MATAVAVWSLKLEPGETEPFVPLSDLRITNIALGETLADENGRTSVKLVYIGPSGSEDDENEGDEDEKDDEDEDAEDKPGSEEPVSTVLCSLTPGKIEQSMVDIILEGDQEYLFESVGKNVIYLTGNYIDQPNRDQPPYDDEDSDSDGDAYDLRDVSSDVEVDPNEMDVLSDDDAHGLEDIDDEDEKTAPVAEEPKPSKKRPRESDSAEADESKLSKKEKKKLKKLKGENGKAVATGETNGAVEKESTKEKKVEEPKKSKLSETEVLAGGVKIADNKIGKGPAAKSGDRVSVRYVGKLSNGKIFDSNTKGKPFQFRLGKGEVIKGWDAGVAGMQAGGERLITVPPAMGYGSKKQAGIPANSTLIFEVKVVQIG